MSSFSECYPVSETEALTLPGLPLPQFTRAARPDSQRQKIATPTCAVEESLISNRLTFSLCKSAPLCGFGVCMHTNTPITAAMKQLINPFPATFTRVPVLPNHDVERGREERASPLPKGYSKSHQGMRPSSA